ncbi:flagellar hook-basal body complex protein FliE [Pseudooceanicola atlanticus]|uniref:Flagellar hook-basal body complex protein FliE n=1 Tax=Pseudooceanicola atlanticus TaxID=1461694 RepID=A0A0A0EA82_9RHOB|nr:flagellar hook-basal body complex protein FliE [Pseudooceanicola atlanticus]KGM46988.1 flagellar biosynthesis protein [Pseudooceanicola atlanticus]
MTDKLITTGLVNNAYGSSRTLQGGPGQGIESAAAAEGVNFADMVKGAAQDVVTSIKESEKVQEAGLVGEVSAQQVVEATLEMETTLRMAVSVRDKLVEAYQQIMQMPI